MELPKVSKEDLSVSQTLMEEFNNNPSKMSLLGSYPYVVNCLYSYSWKLLVIDKVKVYDGSDIYQYPKTKRYNDSKVYSQCELINAFLVHKGVNVKHSNLSAFILIRNKIVHEPKFINSLDKITEEDFPDIEDLETISKLYYGSDICVRYIKAIQKFCADTKELKRQNKKKNKDSRNTDELPDVINSGLGKTQPCPDLMEQLMNQNKE